MTSEPTNPPKRKSRFRRLFRLLIAMIILFLLTTGALLGYLYQKDLPPIGDDVRSKLLDSRGNILATFTSDGRSREPVKLSQISPLLIEATLAVEDRKFYEHSGFDMKGMARAILVNLEEETEHKGLVR